MKRNKSVIKGSIPFVFVLAVIISIFFKTSMYRGGRNILHVEKGVLKMPANSEDEVFFFARGVLFHTESLQLSQKS